MLRRLAPLALLLAAPLVAAPVPKSLESTEQKFVRLFGEKHAPDGCKVELDGDKLKMTLPGKSVIWPVGGNLKSSPHVKREVEGDFEVMVRITSADSDENPEAHCGLFVQINEAEFFQHMRCIRKGPTGKHERYTWSQTSVKSAQKSVWHDVGKSTWETATLKIERRGTSLKAWVSEDGKTWNDPIERELPSAESKVTVGLFAGGYHGTYTFGIDRYEIRPLPVDSKK